MSELCVPGYVLNIVQNPETQDKPSDTENYNQCKMLCGFNTQGLSMANSNVIGVEGVNCALSVYLP